MPVHDFRSQRLYIDAPMSKDSHIACSRDQHNYLCNVLRLTVNDEILVFNGRNGEWRARLTVVSNLTCDLQLVESTRAQPSGPQIDYLFAPLQGARLDYMVQKAVEIGVARLKPVMTERTIVKRVNLERMASTVIEAVQQCGILAIPTVSEPVNLSAALESWPEDRPLIFADEAAEITNPLEALRSIQPGPISVLVGPEGGFSPNERTDLLAKPFVTPISLGPRIMRADTAALATLTLVNACLGDWR